MGESSKPTELCGFGPHQIQRHLLNMRDVEVADVYEMACYGCGGGHDWAYQMGAAVSALAAFEIAIGGAGAALMRGEDISVHADAHAAACVAPLETSVGENFVEALGFGFGLDAARAGNDEGLLDVFGNVLARDEVGGGAKIVDA